MECLTFGGGLLTEEIFFFLTTLINLHFIEIDGICQRLCRYARTVKRKEGATGQLECHGTTKINYLGYSEKSSFL